MTKLQIDEWAKLTDRALKEKYGINFVDAGIDEDDIQRFYAYGDTPEEFVCWYGQKYDLTRLSEWDWGISKKLPTGR